MPRNRSTFEELDNYIALIDKARELNEILDILQKQISLLGFGKLTYWLRWPSLETKKPIFGLNPTKVPNVP